MMIAAQAGAENVPALMAVVKEVAMAVAKEAVIAVAKEAVMVAAIEVKTESSGLARSPASDLAHFLCCRLRSHVSMPRRESEPDHGAARGALGTRAAQ